MTTITTKEFINRARKTHGNFYSYGNTDYKGALDKVIITCPTHGDFSQQAGNHITGNGCPECGKHKRGAPRFTDLTGKQFGKWTVLSLSKRDNLNRTTYLCRCECGNEVTVLGSRLTYGGSTQCRKCMYKNKWKRTFKDITGQKFGLLTVLEFVGFNKNNASIWKCKCDCGNEKNILGYNLKNGRIVSCGCYLKSLLIERGKQSRNNLVGMRFGRLLVTEYCGLYVYKYKYNREAMYKCRCDCGKEKQLQASVLVHGRVISCGCYCKSVNAMRNQQLESKMNMKFKMQMYWEDKRNAEYSYETSVP